MAIIVILISISITIAVIFLGIFLWNVKSGQYDDTYTPSVRMLFDDHHTSRKAEQEKKAKGKNVKKKVNGYHQPEKQL